MIDVRYFLFSLWDWLIQHGLPLSALLIAAILIPRVGRQVVRTLSDRMEEGQEETKGKLALVGALVYMLEIVAYFVIILLALTNLGVPAMGAAIPATVVSAAIGFGSQNIIGDFLSGFFIISERHYGVGDVVTFDDTTGQITGTVVKLTLRSTQIRTVAGELVTVPNSKASVTVNYSQKWSRAVVDMDIPMVNGESMADLLSKVDSAAQQAVGTAKVDADILGDIEIQPARSITPPAAAGQPWSVGMRVGVDTGPADQWLVERAIRANLVNTFWDRFQSPGNMPGTSAELSIPHGSSDGQPSGKHAELDSTGGASDSSGDTEKVLAAAAANTDHAKFSGDDAQLDPAADAADTEVMGTSDDAATQVLPPADSDAEQKAEQSGKAAGGHDDSLVDGPYESKTKNVLSFGGRFRPSTAGLFVALAVVGLLALFSSSPEDGQAGILSPDRWRDGGTAVEETEDTDGTEGTEGNENTGDTGTTDGTQGTEDADGTGNTGNTGGTDGSQNTGESGNPGNTGGTGNQEGTGDNSTGNSGTDTGTSGNQSNGTEQNQGQEQPSTGGDTGTEESVTP